MQDLAASAVRAFGLPATPPAAISAGPRGALGQIYRLEAGGRVYALKELFAGGSLVPEAAVAAEVEFVAGAKARGVRAPASHAAADGRYLTRLPRRGGRFRLYDWMEGRPAPGEPSASACRYQDHWPHRPKSLLRNFSKVLT